MERNDIENINSNQSNQCSYGGAKRSDSGGAHGGGAGLHPSQYFRQFTVWAKLQTIESRMTNMAS